MHANCWPNPINQRLWGADVVRFFSFYAILFFHMTYALWARDGLNVVPVSIPLFETYARLFAFSGFSVLLVSFFLIGLKRKSQKGPLAIWILCFAIAWSALASDYPNIWDIYPFLLVTLGVLYLFKVANVPPLALVAVGAALTSIPFWRLEEYLHLGSWLESVLWGACREFTLGDWPLLPWVGFPIFAFGLGRWAQQTGLKSWLKGEKCLWAIALPGSLFFLGSYFQTPLGDDFSCFVFRRPPIEFWAHQLWILFILRISFLFPMSTSWFARRAVNRHFYLVYFLHYPLCLAMAALIHRTGWAYINWTYWLAIITISALIEYAPVVIFKFFPHNIGIGSSHEHER